MSAPSPRCRLPLAAAGLAALGLAGCISLLPKEKPSQLYRFGEGPPSEATSGPAAGAPAFAVRLAPIGFDRPAATDRILTVSGDQTAYVAGARWVTSANVLFGSAVTRAFDAHGGPARLLAFGQLSHADLVLKIDVRTFEVRYPRVTGADPEVVVEAYGALIDPAAAVGSERGRLFQARVPAASNSVHAIAAAFDRAVTTVLSALTTWVDTRGQS
jgi:cholesterol transport system auxiliary component